MPESGLRLSDDLFKSPPAKVGAPPKRGRPAKVRTAAGATSKTSVFATGRPKPIESPELCGNEPLAAASSVSLSLASSP